MLLLQMSNVKQRILSWENAHGQRALGLRRRFNHALLEAAGKRKRHHEMIDLTGDSDDGTSTNSNNDSSPSKTFDLTSPSTTTRKTKKKGRRKTKDRPSKKRKKDKHVPRGSVPERLTDAIFNDPNLLKRYQKTIGTERLARRFLTKEENEALQHVDPLNLEEELDNDLYWTARQKLSKLRTRIFDTTRVRDTYITCQKFGCTTKTDRLDSFCSKHAARHRKHSENDAQYIRLCTSDLEAFKGTFHRLLSTTGSSSSIMVNEHTDDNTPLEKYLLQGRSTSCYPLGWDKSYLERTPQGTYNDRKDLLKQDYDGCMAKKGGKQYMMVPGLRIKGASVRMPEERYRYVAPDEYDDEGVPVYNNDGVRQALRHFVDEDYMRDFVSGSSFPIDPSTLKWEDDKRNLCVMSGRDTWDGKGMKLSEPQRVARNAIVEIWQTHRARSKTWRAEKSKKNRGHNLFEFRRVRMGTKAIIRELSPFLFVGQSIDGLVEGSYMVFFPHNFEWTN